MNLKEQIQNYIPFNEQEAKDQTFILKAMEFHSNLLFRENPFMHFTSSCWITDPSHSKLLMIYHKIYDSWSWSGGHADGEADLLKVAVKEMKEETGISNYRLISENPFSLEVLTVDGHMKNEQYVSSHLHLNLTYLFEADENETLVLNERETSALKWIPVNEIRKEVSEQWMMDHIYQKLITKMNGGGTCEI